MSKMKILSLGWGVQSWGLLAMSALGILPRVDYAIHADTGWERAETYEFAKKWTPWVEDHGIEVVTVEATEEYRNPCYSVNIGSIFLPAFTTRLNGVPSGMMRRQCTGVWKILPMRRWLSSELRQWNLTKKPGVVQQWLGITLDESHRAKPSKVKYIENYYPYLEMLERPYTRGMVMQWLCSHNLEVPIKSSCVFCPFRRPWQWRELQLSNNGDWERAVEIDRAIRHARPNYVCYLCSDLYPLEDHDFTQQMSLW